MAIPQSADVLHLLRQSVLRYDNAALTDGQLLRSFLYRNDEAAFEALVRRHGPMVRGVCRRVLRNPDDADDAFQAAFLVLIRKASTLTTREVIGDWLHGVAYRTALKARAAAARRRLKEKQVLRHESFFEQEDRSEWLPLLDEEVGRLPVKYRLPVVLCDLEGRTRKEAAQHLGWPEGTVSGRLSRARAMLARRLTQRGVTLSAAALAAGMAGEASARLPLSAVRSICKAAFGSAVGSTAGSVPAQVAALSEGVVKAMFVSKLKNAVALVTVALILTAGAWRYVAVAGQTEEQREQKTQPAKKELGKGAEPREEAKRLAIPSGKRSFQTDLLLTQVKNRQCKVLAYPRLITLDGREVTFSTGPDYVYSINETQLETFLGTNVRIKVCSGESGKLCLVMTVNQPARTTLDREATTESRSIHALRWIELGKPITLTLRIGDKDRGLLEATVAVHEADQVANKDSEVDRFWDFDTIQQGKSGYSKPPAPRDQDKKDFEQSRNASGEKDLKLAELYRRTGHLVSASFYYELVRYRYPETEHAKRARQRQAEFKLPARIGQIFITGNQKISDEIIMEQVKLYPGQLLTYPDLQIAEKNLSRLKGLKSNPKVTVINHEDEFKDIRITVEEK